MELPVWVAGSLRVVCGVSPSTRCQEVVIALAQDIGQTGRYVLTLKRRGSEKQLLADQCPLRELSSLGPDSAHARLILRRTGPSASSLHAQKPSPGGDRQRPRTSTPDPLPPRRSTDAEPDSLYGTYPRRGRARAPPAPSAQREEVHLQPPRHAPSAQREEVHLQPPRHAPSAQREEVHLQPPRHAPSAQREEVRLQPPPHAPSAQREEVHLQPPPHAPSAQKEEVYLRLLRQARTIQELEGSIEEQENRAQESELDRDHGAGLEPELKEQLEALEERQRQNEEELQQEQYWRQQLEEENHRAKDLSVRLEQLQWSVHHQTQRLSSILSRSQHLQTDTQRQTEQALRPLEHELNQRHQQGEGLTAALEQTRREMHNAGRKMRMQVQLLEELNKDLRQCNLQQFILQASGSAPSDLSIQSGTGSAPSDLFVQSGTGSGPYDVTNLRPAEEIYLSSAGILE